MFEKKKTGKFKAFTIVELVLVIIVIGILFVAFISKTDNVNDKAKIAGVQTDFRSFYTALKAVGLENQLYTVSDEEFEELLNENLDDTLKFKKGVSKEKDPWGEPYVYVTEVDTVSKTRYVLFASKGGRDSIELNLEDIVNASSDEMNIYFAVKQVETQFKGVDLESAEEEVVITSLKEDALNRWENKKWAKDKITAADFAADERDIYAYLINGDTLVLRNSPRSETEDITKEYGKLGSSHARNWYNDRTIIKTVNIETPILPKSCNNWFNECRNLTKVKNLDNLITDECTTMYQMFCYCQRLTSLDLSGWNTGNVTSVSYMFYNCQNLTSVGDLSGWDVSNVTSVSYMFNNCQRLTSLDLSGWDTGNFTNTYYMFCYCQNLTSVGDLSGWDVSNVTSVSYMFYNCLSLTSVGDLSGWNTGNVATMHYMFQGCRKLTSVGDLSGWNTGNVTTMYAMFYNCQNLTSVGDLNGWDISKVTNKSNMFTGCPVPKPSWYH